MSNVLTYAIVGHLVGDYLLQNDWMALNKKRAGWDLGGVPCVVHCALWTAAVCVLTGWYAAPVIVPAVLFASHFAQDRTNVVAWWMDLIGQKQFRTGPCAPWSIIVVDNVWHIVALTAVAWWLS